MKRIPVALVAVASAVAMGALTSACEVTPTAASVNGDTISVASLNAQMTALADTGAGRCLLAVRSGQAVPPASGDGWVSTSYAGAVLSNEVGNLVAAQYAADRGIHPSATDRSTAKANYTSVLDGRITSLVQQTPSGYLSACQKPDGSAYSGQEVLAGLPASVRDGEIANQAVDTKLLSLGADLSDAAVLNFYAANRSLFVIDCVSDIATASQADADAIVAKLKAGQSFAALATSSSVDAQTAANGGQLGCNFTESRVLSALQLPSVTVGRPITPVQTSGGTWVIYEVTSQTPVPVGQAAPVVRDDLIHTAANTQRVTAELLVYAHRSAIEVNPQYGTWSVSHIVPPPSPPARYLVPSTPLPQALAGAGASGPTTTGG